MSFLFLPPHLFLECRIQRINVIIFWISWHTLTVNFCKVQFLFGFLVTSLFILDSLFHSLPSQSPTLIGLRWTCTDPCNVEGVFLGWEEFLIYFDGIIILSSIISYSFYSVLCFKKSICVLPWLVWLSWWEVVQQRERLPPVPFPVRTQA